MVDAELEATDAAWRTAAVRDLLAELRDGSDDLMSRINRLAANAVNAPVSLLSLIDEDRQVFVGHHGLPGVWDAAGATPLSHSVCQHVVSSDAAVVIDDIRDSPLGNHSLALRDLDVVAYAGMPLRMSDGQTIGSFCAIDHQPRRWSTTDLEALEDLAVIARDQLELMLLRSARLGRDRLTGLPSREVFEQLVAQALAATRPVSVLAFGLDGFRLVNEALGHAVGDQLLTAVATRLARLVRAGDSVCRLAGDEFLVLCESISAEADAVGTAERLRRDLSDLPYDLAGTPQDASLSVGVATTYDGADAEGLIDVACEALRSAKNGQGRHLSTERTGGARTRLRLRRDIARAHERGELHLAYQPVVDVHTGEIRAVEALMRWTHPELGPVSPAEFIPAAELSGAIVPLGEWAVQQACADVCTWRELPGWQDLVVGVNVAPIQLSVPTLTPVVENALQQTGIPARALGIEITERTLLSDHATSGEVLNQLSAAGLTIAVDDFGTGYSALSYLTRFPIDVVKIDRSFIADMDTNPQSQQLITGILGLATGLGMQTVAEGVETAQQHSALADAGFDWAQGYLYARPMPAEELSQFLSRQPKPRQ